MKRFFALTLPMASLVVMTGLAINLMPSSKVMNVEKPPIAVLGTRLDTQLPTSVNSSTATIITTPFLMSRFLFLP